LTRTGSPNLGTRILLEPQGQTHERTRFDVVGNSKATVDVITSVDDAYLNMHGIAKGGMTLIYVFQAKPGEDAISRTTIVHGRLRANTIAPKGHLEK